MNDKTATMTTSKPYLIRAIHEWILDNGMTPHLVVDANYPATRVPLEFVDEGRIVLNISPGAVQGLVIGNDWIAFNARFGGVAREVSVPSEAVVGIFTRENGQGMVFPDPIYPDALSDSAAHAPGPSLKSVADGAQGSGRPPAQGQTKDKGKGKGGPTLKVVK
ncbi:ClpXP protease specificity-enhancing factor [Thiocystis violascens]|uniref:Stringent starvation protein B n=1 Tax=Thiocystis violascens (strain ATCC 17096 / DSM 198 / 6111) TaxID=765911 RepID=I3YF26_THIV6|nr:ClpXP protease specificity-enhancing factor [Thiocystis violascens]AFL75594.1 stringent starvation protein B [Thiocystis violascens DSM 198]